MTINRGPIIPPVGIAKLDKKTDSIKTYSYDPHIDPSLQWAGKQEGMSFDVPTSSIHIHESIKPHRIIKSVSAIEDKTDNLVEYQPSLFEEYLSPVERMRKRQAAIEFYQHGVDWTNRMIAGDSLVIMNSLLEKENMAGQVQMVYFDPPYGIKYGSNFQPFVNKKDVKDKDEDLSQEPEMIKAFRDTWELGIHSYLTYLRDRLLLAKELLAETGSVFVQISDENVHHVREICDDIFGAENFAGMIAFKKTSGFSPSLLSSVFDYIIWYAKDKSKIKYNKLFRSKKDAALDSGYTWIELENGETRKLTKGELDGTIAMPKGRRFQSSSLVSDGASEKGSMPYKYKGIVYTPAAGNHWKTSKEGLDALAAAGRLFPVGKTLSYLRYIDDFPYTEYTNIWDDTVQSTFSPEKIYVVQTAKKVIQRCMLMTTDPGDLVLDITCGSGTTAYVAEQWGRRWITCDTSRVSIALAKKRLMTAYFDYYKLAHPKQGIGSGMLYNTVPHITLKAIANNLDYDIEYLLDQPLIDKTKVRVTGPFTIEALPSPVVKQIDDESSDENNITSKQADWREQLRATGIRGRNGDKLTFSRVEPLSGTMYLQAEAETKEDKPRRAFICFGSETKPMDSRVVVMALDEMDRMHPSPEIIIFAAFQFDPEAAKMIAEINWPGVTLLTVQMNTDLMTADLKKKQSSDQSFWLVGQPDVELVRDGRSKERYKVIVNGFDYYDVKKGTVESGSTSRIAMWMLDTDYDGMCINPQQVFFPIDGKSGGWNKLAKTLRAEIDQDLIEKYAGTESLWFTAKPNTRIAVKIIDDRGIESMKVIRIGDE